MKVINVAYNHIIELKLCHAAPKESDIHKPRPGPPKPKPKPKPKPEPEPKPEPKSQPKPKPEPKHNPKPNPKADPFYKPKSGPFVKGGFIPKAGLLPKASPLQAEKIPKEVEVPKSSPRPHSGPVLDAYRTKPQKRSFKDLYRRNQIRLGNYDCKIRPHVLNFDELSEAEIRVLRQKYACWVVGDVEWSFQPGTERSETAAPQPPLEELLWSPVNDARIDTLVIWILGVLSWLLLELNVSLTILCGALAAIYVVLGLLYREERRSRILSSCFFVFCLYQWLG